MAGSEVSCFGYCSSSLLTNEKDSPEIPSREFLPAPHSSKCDVGKSEMLRIIAALECFIE